MKVVTNSQVKSVIVVNMGYQPISVQHYLLRNVLS